MKEYGWVSFKALSRMSSFPTDAGLPVGGAAHVLGFQSAVAHELISNWRLWPPHAGSLFQSAVAHELISNLVTVVLACGGQQFQSAVAHELISNSSSANRMAGTP